MGRSSRSATDARRIGVRRPGRRRAGRPRGPGHFHFAPGGDLSFPYRDDLPSAPCEQRKPSLPDPDRIREACPGRPDRPRGNPHQAATRLAQSRSAPGHRAGTSGGSMTAVWLAVRLRFGCGPARSNSGGEDAVLPPYVVGGKPHRRAADRTAPQSRTAIWVGRTSRWIVPARSSIEVDRCLFGSAKPRRPETTRAPPTSPARRLSLAIERALNCE